MTSTETRPIEALELFKHYSTMRFTALPVFTTMYVGMFTLATVLDQPSNGMKTTLRVLAVVVTALSIVFEIRVSGNMQRYERHLTIRQLGSPLWKWVVRALFIAVYLGAAMTLIVYTNSR